MLFGFVRMRKLYFYRLETYVVFTAKRFYMDNTRFLFTLTDQERVNYVLFA